MNTKCLGSECLLVLLIHMINKKDRGAFYTTFVLFQMNCVCVLCSLSLIFCHRWMKRLISALISILLISKAWSGAKTLHNSTPSLLNHQGQCSYHPLLQRKLRKSEREPEPASETGGGSDSYASVTAEFIFQLHILRNHWSPYSADVWLNNSIFTLKERKT